jgi:plasmid stability protein
MAQLIVRNVDEKVVRALKLRAAKKGRSAEAEHRELLEAALLGLALAPCHEFPADAPAAFFSAHALKDSGLAAKLSAFIATGKPVLITDGLAKALAGKVDLAKPNVQVLAVTHSPQVAARADAHWRVLKAGEGESLRTARLWSCSPKAWI